MKKLLIFGIILLVLLSLGAFAKVDKDSDDLLDDSDNESDDDLLDDDSDDFANNESDDDSDDFFKKGKGKGLEIIKGKGKTKIILNESEVETDEDVEVENDTLYINTTKGKKKIKIMPDTASEVAITRLKLLGFTIELKDVGKPVYEINGEQEVKVLGFMKTKMKIKAEIDAETGKVNVKRPWWSFLVFGLDKKIGEE